MRPVHLLLLLVLLLPCVAASDCGKTVGATARGIEAGAKEAIPEIEEMRKRGEIDEDNAKQVSTYLDEVRSSAHVLDQSTVNWKVLSPAKKREVMKRFIGELSASAKRLDDQGYLGIKSEKARKRVDTWRTNLRRGLSALRIIEAAIPVDEEKPATSPTPAPGALVDLPVTGKSLRTAVLQSASPQPFPTPAIESKFIPEL